ncbi:vacuolar protein sorting-associated protein 8 homolog [Zerene cesonia]|uniref:vacuolar protein sorting-associated protein 8 homolog n=1 Tax=Zerene cesonia TaxID=33412 RepID=UPI0018E564E9|nr:vacuolar protein sorting-associated protein 8 homolog [Zerene cesonia]
MDLLKTPSIPSLLDSDLESVDSYPYDEYEELDEVEYALPVSEAPTLEEVLSSDVSEQVNIAEEVTEKDPKEPATCSALQVDFLQAVSQQLSQAEERSSAGPATALSVGTNGRLTVGTAHGHLLSFHDQTLRWVCDNNGDCGAVTCLSYSNDNTRLLAGFARGHVYQYESVRGVVLRKVTLGGETWGTLRVTWAGNAGLALDTGGSVWLMKFSRPLGVRSAKVSCLFSGARGEVVTMTARDARILALATLSRVIIVAGGRAAGVRLDGPADILPVLEWFDTNNRLLVCARGLVLQWLAVTISASNLGLKPIKQIELKTTPLWLGWLGGSLTIFDSEENLRLWGDDYDKPLDLSHIEPVYASAFFKGHWTDGRVSRAMCKAGESALAGACISEGTLSILGRRGIVRIGPRDILTRAQAFMSSGHHLQALRLLCSTQGSKAKALASDFVINLSERPHIVSNKNVAVQVVKLCLKFNLHEELWTCLWENCSNEKAFVEALGDAAVRGEMSEHPPTPDFTQALIEKLADLEPELVERVVASLPLTAIDPHRASVFTRERKLWRGVGAIAAALDGCSGAMRSLVQYVEAGCGQRGRCACAGAALVLAAADALAARSPAARPLPAHARPSARHDALTTLLHEEEGRPSPLRVMVNHDTGSAVRLLEQSSREPPFAGPLGKQNRLRVARALLSFIDDMPEYERRLEILEFVTGQLHNGSLPLDQELIQKVQDLVTRTEGEKTDRAWLSVLMRVRAQRDQLLPGYRNAIPRSRILWRIDALLGNHEQALKEFFQLKNPSEVDIDELFEYVQSNSEVVPDFRNIMREHLPALIKLRPIAAAELLNDDQPIDVVATTMQTLPSERALEFGKCLLEMGRLKGHATTIYLRCLCTSQPDYVKDFLTNHAGLVKPEDALSIVKELGPKDAEPICLEATGDHMAALEAFLELIAAADSEKENNLVLQACELCVRIGPTVPAQTAADMWTRLLRNISSVPPASLFEAIAYLPLEELLVKTCNSAQVGRILADGASGAAMWRCANRIAGREAHEALARALSAARRGVAVRGRCVRCDAPLHERVGARTAHCARAYHADCEPFPLCDCGRRLPSAVVNLPPLHTRQITIPQEYKLLLVAPPRPDLEGVV